MHRLHEDDLVGHVLAQEDWELVRLPAIAEEDQQHRIVTVLGRQCLVSAGEALRPEREPPEMLDQISRTIGEYNFAGQYQQVPRPLGGVAGFVVSDSRALVRAVGIAALHNGRARGPRGPQRNDLANIISGRRVR
jgi:hypothetical protein